MLRAVIEQLRSRRPDVVIAANAYYGDYTERARFGLHQALWPKARRSLAGTLGYWVMRRYGGPFGIIPPDEFDAILDLSGYCYTDALNKRSSARMKHFLGMNGRDGCKVVFLPQAFGPFESDTSRTDVSEMLDSADLIFPRDETSMGHLTAAGVEASRMQVVPDMSMGLSATGASMVDPSTSYACVVPNARILSHGDGAAKDAYVSFLTRSAEWLDKAGMAPILCKFEKSMDDELAAEVSRRARCRLPQVVPGSADELRDLVGGAKAVVGSRYHALVSALSQGVPVLATSWAHKYHHLLADYGMEEMMIQDFSDVPALESKLAELTRMASSEEALSGLAERAALCRARLGKMWDRVDAVIGLSRAAGTEGAAEK